MFYFVYVIQFDESKKMYKGYTKNLKLRLEQHRKGLAEYTKDKGSFKLVYFEGCLNQQDATHREKYLKTYLGRFFLKNRLKSYLIR
jgi:putative endonuclease